jgi:flagellar hook protein FlgE
VQSGALELSNVDLTTEFANLITTQRSFEAGSRLITVSDTILEDIVNLKTR